MQDQPARRFASACPAILTAVFALMATPSATAAGKGSCPGSGAAPGSVPSAAITKAVICEINRERATRGLRRVHADRRLSRMAARYARAMVRQQFFSHTSPGGATMAERLRATGYGGRRWTAGEALAWGSGSRATPRRIVYAWMHSPPHRAVLLGRSYRDVGIGVALGSPYGGRQDRSATYAAELGRAAG
jgi:uncharacterized protein YkwD